MKVKNLRLIVIAVVSGILLTAAQADIISGILEKLFSLGGIGGLVSIVLDLLKRFGVVKDGAAPVWNAVASLIIAVLMLVFPLFNITVDWTVVDSTASIITQVLSAIAGFIGLFGITKFTHFVFRGSPIGFSHS